MADRGFSSRSTELDQYAVFAMTFVERVSGMNNAASVYAAFNNAMADFGIEYFIMVDLPRDAPTSIPRVLLSKAPIGWTDLYMRNGYQEHDPVFDQCRVASRPFEWKDVVPPRRKRRRALEVMNNAREFGLADGLTVPVHNFDGTSSCVSMSGTQPYVNRFTKTALHLMSIYAFEQARQLTMLARPNLAHLTDREREVLTWAAVGKSASGIADILRISERTAIAHSVNAAHKLGASNKTHAVALALKRNLINL